VNAANAPHKMPQRLSPNEVKQARLVPYEIKRRYGYDGDTDYADLPAHVLYEIEASQAAYDESQKAGTLQQDYPQLFRLPGPFDDLVSVDGLTIHEYQL
jgi:hypothetical protein